LWNNGQKVVLEANENLVQNKIYAPDLIQEKAIGFIKEQSSKQPFSCFYPIFYLMLS
jgi:hypothetical protein